MSLMKELVGRCSWSDAVTRVGRFLVGDVLELKRQPPSKHRKKFLNDSRAEMRANKMAGDLIAAGESLEAVADQVEARYPYAMVCDYLREDDPHGYMGFFNCGIDGRVA